MNARIFRSTLLVSSVLLLACGESSDAEVPAATTGAQGGTSASAGGASSTAGVSSGGSASAGDSAGGAAAGAGGTAGPAHVWGITIDDPRSDTADTAASIAALSQPMVTRLVFDAGEPASSYHEAVAEIAAVSTVMGEIVDSFEVADYSVEEYVARTNEYMDELGDLVGIWEIGNEINGEWLGDSDDVAAKMALAWQAVHERGLQTALTLYYNGTYDGGVAGENNCWENPENQMQVWAAAHVPEAMRSGLDYVWVSYYEQDCLDLEPNWQAVFDDLAVLFPTATLGIGECGTDVAEKKQTWMERYYRDLQVDQERYVGGYFWWYGKQDLVPKTNPLWQVLQDAMAARLANE